MLPTQPMRQPTLGRRQKRYAGVIALFPATLNISTQAREHPEIRMGNGGATEDVQAAGRAKLPSGKEPTYKKKGRRFKNPGAATSRRNTSKTSGTLDTKFTSIERNYNY